MMHKSGMIKHLIARQTGLASKCFTAVTPGHITNLGDTLFASGIRPQATSAACDDILYSRIEAEVKGHDVAVLNSYEKFVTATAKELDVTLTKVETPDRVIERMSLLKSAHIYKKHFVQYETRTNYRTFHFKNLTGSTADILIEYIQRNLPEGVAMKTTRTQILELPKHINRPELQDSV